MNAAPRDVDAPRDQGPDDLGPEDQGPQGQDPEGVAMRSWEVLAADAVGNVIEFWGFKHNHGRLWALLYLRDQPLTASELQEQLGLSKGAVSMLVRELEQWEVLQRVREPGEPLWRFQANADFMQMVRRVFASRESAFLARVAADLRRAREAQRADPDAGEEQARRLGRMTALAERTEQIVRVFLATSVLDATPLFEALRDTARRLGSRRKE